MTNNAICIYEVGPRDGLQNEPGLIPVHDKLRLIAALAETGLRDIEVGSFVSPAWVPQMADTAAVLAGLRYDLPINYATLIPNQRGWSDFVEASQKLPRRPGEIAVFISASEGFSRANLNCSVGDSLDRIAPVVAAATEMGIRVRGYVSCVVRCPFDGEVTPAQVVRAVEGLRALAPMSISLGDTIGAGTPDAVRSMVSAVAQSVPVEALAGHFHDTGGQALANIEACLDLGLRTFDAAVGGLGGCPYAPGAPGNVDTCRVVDRLEALGLASGVDRDALARAAEVALAIRSKARGMGVGNR